MIKTNIRRVYTFEFTNTGTNEARRMVQQSLWKVRPKHNNIHGFHNFLCAFQVPHWQAECPLNEAAGNHFSYLYRTHCYPASFSLTRHTGREIEQLNLITLVFRPKLITLVFRPKLTEFWHWQCKAPKLLEIPLHTKNHIYFNSIDQQGQILI